MKHKLFTLLITVVCIAPAKIHVGPVCTGIGSWISFNKNDPYHTSYNKLSSDVYLSYKGWSGFFGIPFQCVVSHRDETKYAFSPGDFNFYIGRRISFVQPRLGLVFPLWYSTDKGVWLGSKNVILKTGLGFSYSLSADKSWRTAGELYYKYYIAGFPEIEDSRRKRGSWAIDGSVKLVNSSFNRWKLGIEFLGGFRKLYPKYPQGYQLSASCVPHVFATYDVNKRMYLSAKTGFGPSLKREDECSGKWKHSSNSLNIAVSTGFYP